MPVTVKHGSKKSIPKMKALWRETFGDSDEFIDTFFSDFYKPSKTLLAFESGELVSMLYRMDVNVKYFKKKLKCAYLYGVATKLEERRRGHFTRLHGKMLEELRDRHYDAVIVLPENESLYSLYRDIGYNISLKRFNYKLFTQDIEETHDVDAIWRAKKELHRSSSFGISVLETLPQFKESRRGHRFFAYGTAFLAFAPGESGYSLYEIISPQGESVPVEQVHYEKSALIMDLTGALDRDLIEKQKPQLSYLLN